ncbi:E3 ubiquitin-protein ligase TRIM39-like [Aulostomus maculatus]
MSATSCLLSEDQFLCCICLDVFTDPVTIPCGHNFCKTCISHHWNINQVKCQCPMCKKTFKCRPQLPVNTFISDMVSEFRQSVENKGIKDFKTQVAKPGEVPCDVCTAPKLKALKSCLTCLASYCGIHLDPHLTANSLQKHQLIDPVENMESRVCTKHKKPLELFCRTDQKNVCSHCSVSDHVTHNIVSVKDEYEAKKVELERAEAEVQKIIQDRQFKIQQIQNLKKHRKEDAEREISNGVRIFTILMQTAERSLNELIEMIEEEQKMTEKRADGFIREIQQEISALEKRSAEMQQLSCTQDHLHLLQNSSLLDNALLARNRMEVSFHPPPNEGTVMGAVTQLEEIFKTEKKQLLHKFKLKRVQHYAVDVTLEPDSANPWLELSDDAKQVNCGKVRKDLPDNPERFSLYTTVLAQQSFSSGRFYYEVVVSGKSDWTLGVVKGSVNRKGIIPVSPLNGYWAVGLRNGNEYLSLTSPVVGLSLNSRPQTVGVFVSYEDGLVSFYDVDAAVHLYSFTGCSFSDKLYPFFSPGLHHGDTNSAPLIISPVDHSD